MRKVYRSNFFPNSIIASFLLLVKARIEDRISCPNKKDGKKRKSPKPSFLLVFSLYQNIKKLQEAAASTP